MSRRETTSIQGNFSADEVLENSSAFTPPAYTIKEVHNAIPAHCFRPNTLLSIAYIVRDFATAFVFAYIAITYVSKIENQSLRIFAWGFYSFWQGLVFTGLWELAHECGHGALSKKKWVNDVMGMIMHSFLLVPYHAWRLTHSTHHKTTNNLNKDIAFIPDTKKVYFAKRNSRGWFMKSLELLEDVPFFVLLETIGHQLIAFPTYLLINNFALPRMAATPWWKRSHFYIGGDGPNFKPRNRKDIVASNCGIAVSLTLLWLAGSVLGWGNVMKVYGVPYLWTNHWILTITYLHHNDRSLPFYSTKSWTFVRGAACTIDRNFGFIGRYFFHGAIENHVVHHHASRIPFYHTVEASKALRRVMGTQYRSDFETPYLWAFWKLRSELRFVEDVDEGHEIYFFPKSM